MAVGSLLQTYLSRFGVSMEGMSGETIGFAAALDAVARAVVAQQLCGNFREAPPIAHSSASAVASSRIDSPTVDSLREAARRSAVRASLLTLRRMPLVA